MYTGGVSSLAEQIANQLQRKEPPKALLDKKELVRDVSRHCLARRSTAVGNTPVCLSRL